MEQQQEQDYHNNNWDLQAVVRGFLPSQPTNPFDPFASLSLLIKEEQAHKDSTISLPDLMSTPSGLQELEELCMSFLPKPISPTCQTQLMPLQPIRQTNKPNRPVLQTPKSKRRKNQPKKVVCQVRADGLSGDLWAWRKYGQKPIKGSPHPRGYYKCSSSKACPARKQVERSRTDCGTLIITYTAEHNHAVPVHRNSLAGVSRQKCPTTTGSAAGAAGAGGSPTTPLMTSLMEDEMDVEVCGEDEFLFLGQKEGEKNISGGNGGVQFERIGDDFAEFLDG